MTTEPGYMPFKFDRDVVTAYVAAGSTGWTGFTDVGGLPESRTWGGARITYAPSPEGARNPYDIYLYTPTARVNYTDYNWPTPAMLTTNRYVTGRIVPVSASKIREGDPIFLTYAFDEYWRGKAFDVTNRFTLSGAKTATFDLVTADGAYYAHWREASPGGGTEQPPPDGGDTGSTPVLSPWTTKKAVVLDGAVYDADGNVAGVGVEGEGTGVERGGMRLSPSEGLTPGAGCPIPGSTLQTVDRGGGSMV